MREVRDGARHAEIVEGRSGPVSDLCWRYLGVVKAGEIEAGHLLGTFEYQPSLVGTRSPNRDGVIGTSLVIGKTSLVSIVMPVSLAKLPLVLACNGNLAPLDSCSRQQRSPTLATSPENPRRQQSADRKVGIQPGRAALQVLSCSPKNYCGSRYWRAGDRDRIWQGKRRGRRIVGKVC